MEQFIETLDSIYSLALLLEKEKASCLIQRPKPEQKTCNFMQLLIFIGPNIKMEIILFLNSQ